MSKLYIALATLIGTIVGAGFLGMPFVYMKSGFGLGMINLLVLSIVLLITMLYLGEIVLRTKTDHQLSGYAGKYLGKKGKRIMFFSFAFGIYAALTAYLIAQGESISFLLFGTTEYQLLLGIVFWFFLSTVSYLGIKFLEESEPVNLTLLLIFIISIVLIAWNKIDFNNLKEINPRYVFLPFGVTLFSLLGFSAIPTVREILKDDKKLLKKTIYLAYIIVALIYIIFTAIVIGYKGSDTPPLATLALGKPFIILGIISMLGSYAALTAAMMETYKLDYKFSKNKAWSYAVFIPLFLFVFLELIKKAEFTNVIGIGGVISGGINAILILLMIKKAKDHSQREPEYSLPYSRIIVWIFILIFSLGAIIEIFSHF